MAYIKAVTRDLVEAALRFYEAQGKDRYASPLTPGAISINMVRAYLTKREDCLTSGSPRVIMRHLAAIRGASQPGEHGQPRPAAGAAIGEASATDEDQMAKIAILRAEVNDLRERLQASEAAKAQAEATAQALRSQLDELLAKTAAAVVSPAPATMAPDQGQGEPRAKVKRTRPRAITQEMAESDIPAVLAMVAKQEAAYANGGKMDPPGLYGTIKKNDGQRSTARSRKAAELAESQGLIVIDNGKLYSPAFYAAQVVKKA